MSFHEVIERRFSEEDEVNRKRRLIDWYLNWLASQTNGVIVEYRRGLCALTAGGEVREHPVLCEEAAFSLTGEVTGVKIVGGYDSGGFRIELGGLDEPRSALDKRYMSSARVNEAYLLLQQVTQTIYNRHPELRNRLENQKLD